MMDTTFKTRPLSWSQLSSFAWDKEQWYDRYILGNKSPDTPELIFGKIFANSCEIRQPLAPVTLLKEMEKAFKVAFAGIHLTGFADTYKKTIIGEYKTGAKPWDQKRVDTHGQITMYALMNYITYKIKPDDCIFFLEWIPTEKVPRNNGDFSGFDYDIKFQQPIRVEHFKTKRTMKDILEFGQYIIKTVKEMEEFAKQKDS